MVTSQVMELVDEIRRRRLSRNKHFTLFRRQEYREARRILRYLDGLAEELEALATEGDLVLGLAPAADGRVELRLVVERLQLRRRCFLTREELDDLRRNHPHAAELIAAAEGRGNGPWANDTE